MNRYATLLALAGGALGIVAGVAQAVAASKLGSWAGGKSDPVPLGVLTIVLSGVAVAAALVLRGGPHLGDGRRAALATAVAVPAVVCFTTVGRLWWIPGALLLASASIIVAGAPMAVARAVAQTWLGVLTALLGACLALVAATAGPPMLAFGLAGGLAIAAAPWLADRSRTAALVALVLGSVPFAAVTWWTVITPIVAIMALVTGLAEIRSRTRHAARPAPPLA